MFHCGARHSNETELSSPQFLSRKDTLRCLVAAYNQGSGPLTQSIKGCHWA